FRENGLDFYPTPAPPLQGMGGELSLKGFQHRTEHRETENAALLVFRENSLDFYPTPAPPLHGMGGELSLKGYTLM
ncbi:MAG: hypothetical protein IJK51_09765, partial [Bacteroidaceae bacterium]|nr:hypothetical protein [Bacteroidaceae bacterium]